MVRAALYPSVVFQGYVFLSGTEGPLRFIKGAQSPRGRSKFFPDPNEFTFIIMLLNTISGQDGCCTNRRNVLSASVFLLLMFWSQVAQSV
jgi:hypothetical protein